MEKKILSLGFWMSFAIVTFYILLIPLSLAIPVSVISAILKIEIQNTHPLVNLFYSLFSFWLIFLWVKNVYTLELKKAFRWQKSLGVQLIFLVITLAGLSFLLSEWDNLVRKLFPISEYYQKLFSDIFGGNINIFWAILSAVIVIPVIEEILLRGIVLKGLLTKYQPLHAVLISALLFAAMHLNIWQFSNAFVLGLLFGWIYIKTKSLLPCIVGHIFNNAFPFILAHFPDLKIPGYTVDSGFQPLWFNLLGGLLTAIGIGALFILFRQRRP